MASLQTGATQEQVAFAILNSAEFSAKNPSNPAFVTALYQQLLDRAPAAGEINGWVNNLNNGASRATVIRGIMGSQEQLTLAVKSFYVQFLHRQGAANEVQGWLNSLAAGATLADVARAIVASDGFYTNSALSLG